MTDAIESFAEEWAALTKPARIRVVDSSDGDGLLEEALASGELQPLIGDRYYARSYAKDTARSEERTFVATSQPGDRGLYNNWRPASDLKAKVTSLMNGASSGKTMYAIPYLMSNPGSPLERWAAGVELTDSRLVVLHMLRMTRVGRRLLAGAGDDFVRGVHVTGDLENLGQGTEQDRRHFVTVADERLILHYGSSYGGNALLGKIAHGLRLASYDGHVSRRFLAEQFMLIGIRDKLTGHTRHIAGGFPSASGKTNLAMMVPPPPLDQRFEVQFLGDDIAWLYVEPADGRVYAMNPEYGVFGVAKDTNERTNPHAMAAIGEGSQALFTNTAFNPIERAVWWEGRSKSPPPGEGWLDWRGNPATPDGEWAHPNSRFTTALANVPSLSPSWQEPRGVPVDAIIFGGRVRGREPLIRALPDLATGVYDGITLGAEATAAAEGKAGLLRYDPMSMRPFMSYGEGDYARHWLDVIGAAAQKPIFAHVNWFQRDERGRYLWPGYGENLRALLWLLDLVDGKATGAQTPIGTLPLRSELNLEGLEVAADDLERLLAYDADEWRQEIESRSTHLGQLRNLPREIKDAHTALAKAVG